MRTVNDIEGDEKCVCVRFSAGHCVFMAWRTEQKRAVSIENSFLTVASHAIDNRACSRARVSFCHLSCHVVENMCV